MIIPKFILKHDITIEGNSGETPNGFLYNEPITYKRLALITAGEKNGFKADSNGKGILHPSIVVSIGDKLTFEDTIYTVDKVVPVFAGGRSVHHKEVDLI
jgi:hypothetical protein